MHLSNFEQRVQMFANGSLTNPVQCLHLCVRQQTLRSFAQHKEQVEFLRAATSWRNRDCSRLFYGWHVLNNTTFQLHATYLHKRVPAQLLKRERYTGAVESICEGPEQDSLLRTHRAHRQLTRVFQ
jgi:hypothetical protein